MWTERTDRRGGKDKNNRKPQSSYCSCKLGLFQRNQKVPLWGLKTELIKNYNSNIFLKVQVSFSEAYVSLTWVMMWSVRPLVQGCYEPLMEWEENYSIVCNTKRNEGEMKKSCMISSFSEERWVSHPACLPVTSLPPSSCSMIIHFHIILKINTY